jgi:hypothetical protein
VPDQEVQPDPLSILDDKDEQQPASCQRGDGPAAEPSTTPAGRNLLWHELPPRWTPGANPSQPEHFTLGPPKWPSRLAAAQDLEPDNGLRVLAAGLGT